MLRYTCDNIEIHHGEEVASSSSTPQPPIRLQEAILTRCELLPKRQMGRCSSSVHLILHSLSEGLKFRMHDGPSKTLLQYMKKFNFTAPSTWKQYRPLTSK